jgi:Holliday junction resolvase RusA-like endonuclease
MITFTVPGIPSGKGRARFVRATGRAYTPAKTVSYEGQLKHFAQQAMNGREPLQGPLSVSVEAIFPKPVSWSKKRAAATLWHTSKPDSDNLLKCLDGLNGVVWRDDAQIARAEITKIYSTDGSAWLRVIIEPLGEP